MPRDTTYRAEMWDLVRAKCGAKALALEIGTWRGHWAEQLFAYGPPAVNCVCIDPWSNKQNGGFTKNAKAWFSRMAVHWSFGHASILRGTSNEWAGVWPSIGSHFNLIFIDAVHRYPNVLEDLRNWWIYLEPGGLLLIHDCDLEPVRLAAEEFFSTQREELQFSEFGPRKATGEVLTGWVVKRY